MTEEPYYTRQVRDPPSKDDFAAIDLLIHSRPRILKAKLAVLATQIQERLHIRANNVRRIEARLGETGSKLIPFREPPIPGQELSEAQRTFWLELESKLEIEARAQDVDCWRDVAQVMNEFLTVWEAVEQSQVRAEFLREQRSEDDL